MENLTPQKKWYKKGWGITVIILLSIILLVIGIFVFTTVKYMYLIKSGKGDKISSKFYNSFQSDIKGSVSVSASVRSDLENGDDPHKGNPAAEIVIVEFIDFKCPLCKQADSIMKQVMQNYAHKVKYIVRDFPVESIHPGVTKYHELAECAYKQGRYWQMHDALFSNQNTLKKDLDDKTIRSLASLASADYTKLKTCFSNGGGKIAVNKDYAVALKHSAAGTPTYFINGQKFGGVIPYASWKKFLK